VKNFVFDLYGTLAGIRTDENSQSFKRKFLQRCGDVFNNVDFFKRYGEIINACPPLSEPDVCKVFIEIAAEGGREISYKNAWDIAQIFRELSLKKLWLYPYVGTMLKGLKKGGAEIIILSNAQSAFTLGEIKRLKLDTFCDKIELSSDFGKKKPAREFFLHAIEKYNLDPSETIYIGNDIACDIVGAKSVGLKTAYIFTAISPQTDSLEKARLTSDFITPSHKDVKTLLLSLFG